MKKFSGCGSSEGRGSWEGGDQIDHTFSLTHTHIHTCAQSCTLGPSSLVHAAYPKQTKKVLGEVFNLK